MSSDYGPFHLKSPAVCAAKPNVNGIKISIQPSLFSSNRISLKAEGVQDGLKSTETAGV